MSDQVELGPLVTQVHFCHAMNLRPSWCVANRSYHSHVQKELVDRLRKRRELLSQRTFTGIMSPGRKRSPNSKSQRLVTGCDNIQSGSANKENQAVDLSMTDAQSNELSALSERLVSLSRSQMLSKKNGRYQLSATDCNGFSVLCDSEIRLQGSSLSSCLVASCPDSVLLSSSRTEGKSDILDHHDQVSDDTGYSTRSSPCSSKSSVLSVLDTELPSSLHLVRHASNDVASSSVHHLHADDLSTRLPNRVTFTGLRATPSPIKLFDKPFSLGPNSAEQHGTYGGKLRLLFSQMTRFCVFCRRRAAKGTDHKGCCRRCDTSLDTRIHNLAPVIVAKEVQTRVLSGHCSSQHQIESKTKLVSSAAFAPFVRPKAKTKQMESVKCPVCGRKYARKSKLVAHLQVQHASVIHLVNLTQFVLADNHV